MTQGEHGERRARPASLTRLTIGFVPLIDAALLIAAREEGFAAAEGIDLNLVREGSWAAIRDKLNVGLFDAAHMLAPAAIASVLGIGHLKVPLIAPLALGLDGNAITVSQAIAATLQSRLASPGAAITPARTAAEMARLVTERRNAGKPKITVGVVFGFSCHLYQVRAWLQSGGIDPEADINVVVIPPPLMVESLSAGLIDLFCAGSPWNRMAELAGAGVVLHACSSIVPDCLEKLLVLKTDLADEPWLPGLVRAIGRAATWASAPEHRSLLARHLARPDYVGAPVSVIEGVLSGQAATLLGDAPADWIRFDLAATIPTTQRLRSVFEMMQAAGHVGPDPALWSQAAALVRPQLHTQALGGTSGGR
ncbi:MAG: ABC transporter substrate-binding protein [Beijerinckiaceae bacterium]|jgi:NitT/TauT family transport system ATP-binding protein|nr:ABC transporter substrate-binding protein [Beijerinckiaceae bacterium]